MSFFRFFFSLDFLASQKPAFSGFFGVFVTFWAHFGRLWSHFGSILGSFSLKGCVLENRRFTM